MGFSFSRFSLMGYHRKLFSSLIQGAGRGLAAGEMFPEEHLL